MIGLGTRRDIGGRDDVRSWLALIIFLLFAVSIGVATWMSTINSDSAFNFQVAQSLQENFSYQTRYSPPKVYHDLLTTNGPIQYFMAAMLGLFELDLGRSIALGAIAGLAAVTILFYSRQAFALYCLLILLWPYFAWLHTSFMGEVFAITMIMAGITFWEVWVDKAMRRAPPGQDCGTHPLWGYSHFWLCGLAFGVAISTKLMALPVLLLLLFCLAVYRGGMPLSKWALVGGLVVLPTALALVVFVLQFCASILHSGGEWHTLWPTLKLFVSSHFQQVENAARLQTSRWLPKTDSIPAIVVFVGLFILVARRHAIFVLVGIVCAVLLLKSHLDLRRLMPLLASFMFIAMKESSAPVGPLQEQRWRAVCRHSSLLGAGVILVVGAFLSNAPIYLVRAVGQFTPAGAAHNVVIASAKSLEMTYDISLISTVKSLPGRVFTSGWWQYPEISLRANTTFYNRFASENKYLLQGSGGCYLLFSSENPKDHTTEHVLCGEILYRDGALTLCRYSPP